MFYAFVHKYGPEMRGNNGERIGYVQVFHTKRRRDDFVKLSHDYERISSKTARSYLIDELLAKRPRLRDDVAHMGMTELALEIVAARYDN